MHHYQYLPLLPGPYSIRLIRILPDQNDKAPVRCQIFNYSLAASRRSSHLYECLSYVWGSPENKQTIYVDDAELQVTKNLLIALRRLRDPDLDRILWIDAICINQEDVKERGLQVQFMARIYQNASRVNVWLGEEAGRSTEVLEAIHSRANSKPQNTGIRNRKEEAKQSIYLEDLTPSVSALLCRPWFHRVWVLQEIAAARYISVLCGPVELTGICFCRGLEQLTKTLHEKFGVAHQISCLHLMSISNSASTFEQRPEGPSTLAIRPLSELVDIFHGHQATDRRDRIYALLGMGSQNEVPNKISPDYELPWKSLFHNFISSVLGPSSTAVIHTWDHADIAVIRSRGLFLGYVSKVEDDDGNNIAVNVRSRHMSNRSQMHVQAGYGDIVDNYWVIPRPPWPVRCNDIACLLEGTENPMIVRPQQDYYSILVSAVTIPVSTSVKIPFYESYIENVSLEQQLERHPYPPSQGSWSDFIQSGTSSKRNFLLVWDWTQSSMSEECSTLSQLPIPGVGIVPSVSESPLDMIRIFEDYENDVGFRALLEELKSRRNTFREEISRLPLDEYQKISDQWFGWKSVKLLIWTSVTSQDHQIYQDSKASTPLAEITYPDLIELQKLVSADAAFPDLIISNLDKNRLKGETSDYSYVKELVLFLDIWGKFVSPHAVVQLELRINAHEEHKHKFKIIEPIVELAARHDEWGETLISAFFDACKDNYFQIYRILRAAVVNDAWRSETISKVFTRKATDLLDMLNGTDICQFAALNRPFDSVLDFLYESYRNENAKRWRECRNACLANFQIDKDEVEKCLQTHNRDCDEAKDLLWVACRYGNKAYVEALLAFGNVNVNWHIIEFNDRIGNFEHDPELPFRITNFRSAFTAAMMGGHVECCRLLLEAGFRTPMQLEVFLSRAVEQYQSKVNGEEECEKLFPIPNVVELYNMTRAWNSKQGTTH